MSGAVPEKTHGGPLVLIASVSAHEGRAVERALASTGWRRRPVAAAEEAARAIDGDGRAGVLVIDAGLLEAPHDSQWRDLRSRHGGLATVIRCLNPEAGTPQWTDDRTLCVHPDDAHGVREAVRALCRPELPAA